ncbi:MAG: cupin domain-containing protein [Emergencia sp.]|nr:cupin domain-containing protein [Emergencia sp.]
MKHFSADKNLNEAVVTFFSPEITRRDNVQMGSAVMEPHTESGWGVHDGDEYSYFIKGNITVEYRDCKVEVKAGDAIFTPAGAEHRSINDADEPCEVIWIEVAK